MMMNDKELLDLQDKMLKLKQILDNSEDDFDYNLITEETGVDIKQLEKDIIGYQPKLPLGFTKLHPDAVEPKYNYPSDSGFDMLTLLLKSIFL